MDSISTEKKQIVVLSGPTGSGKNAILTELLRRCSNGVRLVTATSRAPRPGEVDGEDYYFFSDEQFMDALAKGEILEHRDIPSLGTHYGIFKPDLERKLAAGNVVLAQLDIIGARFLKEKYGATTIFINAPSLDSLRERIRVSGRNMSEEELERRIEIARREISEYAPEYDYQVINADGHMEDAVNEIIRILEKEGFTLQI